MLRHEDIPQAHPLPAAKVRVTPEELAAAITALQLRKEGQPGTIAIGDAVEELRLDLTPEEVLAEVQERRQEKPKRPRSRGWDRAVLALGLGGIALWGSFFVMPNNPFEDPSTISTNVTAITGAPSIDPAYIRMTAAPNLTVGDASGKILMLSEVGDDQPIRCTFDNQSSTLQHYYPNSSALWRLVKHNGKVYVRGWMLNVSQRVMAEEGVDVATENNSGFNVPVTLPLDGFKVLPVAGSVAQFHAVNVYLDKHAYEKW